MPNTLTFCSMLDRKFYIIRGRYVETIDTVCNALLNLRNSFRVSYRYAISSVRKPALA